MIDTDTSTSTPMGGGHPAAALGALVIAATLTAAAIVLLFSTRPEWSTDQWYFVVDAADAVVFGILGWVLLSRTRDTVAWIVALVAVGGGLAALSFQWTAWLPAHPTAPAPAWFVAAQGWAWIPGTLALILVVPWLVAQRPLRRTGRIGVAAGVAVTAGLLLTRLTDPSPGADGEPFGPLPLRFDWWAGAVERTNSVLITATVALGFLAASGVFRTWRRRPFDERRGLGWLVIAVALMTATFVPLAYPFDAHLSALPAALTPLLHLTSQLFFPAALLVALLGQRLWGLRVAIDRTLVWSVLTGGVVIGFVALLAVFGELLPLSDQTAQVLSVAAVAGMFQPAQAFVQRRVDRLVRGEATAPLRIVGHVASRVDGTVSVLDSVVTGVGASLRLGGVAIDVMGPDGPSRSASTGVIDDTAMTWPLALAQAEIGQLVVAPRPGERLDRTTVQTLADLAPLVATVVQLLDTTAQLAESRQRIAAARDEERRVLRRELHDGLGPALAGIGLGLRAARNLLAADPDAAVILLDQLADETDQRVEEVRGLARGLVPPALEEMGLVPALRELAERHAAVGGLLIGVDAPEDVAVTPEQAGALYGIVSEAVRNVDRHARASRCDITVRAADDRLDVTVTDDGVGIDETPRAGVGLTSMRERAEGIGGSLRVARNNGRGTTVEARVPLDGGGER